MSEINSDMLVSEFIKSIESKVFSINDTAKYFDCSERTIQKKIKNLGYEWNYKQSHYEYKGTAEQRLLLSDMTVSQLFGKVERQQKASRNNTRSNSGNASKKESKSDSEINVVKAIEKNDTKDRIDEILLGSKAKKKYTGFYADEDIASILDSVDKRKSELINECLRIVFKSKGLL